MATSNRPGLCNSGSFDFRSLLIKSYQSDSVWFHERLCVLQHCPQGDEPEIRNADSDDELLGIIVVLERTMIVL